MKALTIAAVNLRILLRDRTSLFFIFALPMILILVLGAAFGRGNEPRLTVVAEGTGPLTERLVTELRGIKEVKVTRSGERARLLSDVERGRAQAGVVIPVDYDTRLHLGGMVAVQYLARQDQLGLQLGVAVRAAVAGQSERLRAVRFAQAERGIGFSQGLAETDRIAAFLPGVTLRTSAIGDARFPSDLGQFDLGASQELLLFVFLTAMTGSVVLITSRRLGVSRRMLATPTPVRTILAGEALARLATALLQGTFIMVGSALLFGVDWGDPFGAIALLVAFGLVGSGAAMLLGSTLRTEQQAGGLGIFLALGLGSLGGSMMPLEFFSSGMRTVAHLTPHAWANDAFTELIRHGGGLGDILPQLGVLLGYAAVLFTVGVWLLRRKLSQDTASS